MSNAAKGVYLDFLAWSWDNGPLPSDERQRARLASERVPAFRRLWSEMAEKWMQTKDGYVNGKLEETRRDVESRIEMASARGRKGAIEKARRYHQESAQLLSKHCLSNTQAALEQCLSSAQAESKHDLSSARVLLKPKHPKSENQIEREIETVPRTEHAVRTRAREADGRVVDEAGAWKPPDQTQTQGIINGARLRRHGQHAWCADREGLCIPQFLHEEFIGKLGRPEAESELLLWYPAALAPFAGQPIGEDGLVFWRNLFAQRVGVATQKPAVTKGRRISQAWDDAHDAIEKRRES